MQRTISLFVLAVLVLSFAIPSFAQDDMMDAHVCDSTTILLLFIAENDYDFHSMMDVSTFEGTVLPSEISSSGARFRAPGGGSRSVMGTPDGPTFCRRSSPGSFAF